MTSQTVIDEAVGHSEKLHTTKDEIERFIAVSGLAVRESVTLNEIQPYEDLIDKEDAHLIAGTERTHCAYLVWINGMSYEKTYGAFGL